MKHFLLTLIYFGALSSIYCQSKSSIEIAGGIVNSFRFINSSAADSPPINIPPRDIIRSGARPVVNGSVGIYYNRRITNNILLKTGVSWQVAGYNAGSIIDTVGLAGSCIPVCATFEPVPLGIILKSITNHRFIAIPLLVRWELNSKKFAPFIETGMAASIYQSTRGITTTASGTSSSLGDIGATFNNKNHLVGILSIGLNYLIKPKYQLYLQPTFRYHFQSFFDWPIKEQLYQYGIEIGVRRLLK